MKRNPQNPVPKSLIIGLFCGMARQVIADFFSVLAAPIGEMQH